MYVRPKMPPLQPKNRTIRRKALNRAAAPRAGEALLDRFRSELCSGAKGEGPEPHARSSRRVGGQRRSPLAGCRRGGYHAESYPILFYCFDPANLDFGLFGLFLCLMSVAFFASKHIQTTSCESGDTRSLNKKIKTVG